MGINSDKHIYIVPNYQSLLFALSDSDLNKIKVITRNKSISVFCEKIKIECLYLEVEKDYSISSLKKYKSKVDDELKSIKKSKIYFCFYGYALVELYILLKLKNSNDAYYHPLNTDPIYPTVNLNSILSSFHNFKKTLFNWTIYFYVYKVRFNFFFKNLFSNSKPEFFLGLKYKRLASEFKVIEKVEDGDSNFNSNSIKIQNELRLPNYDVIYIDNLRKQHQDQYSIIKDVLFAIQDQGYNVAVKPHPSHGIPDVLNGFNQVDKTLPSELLSCCAQKSVIGMSSTSLRVLNRDLKVISLLFLLDIFSEQGISEIQEFLGDGILYPRSKEELLEQLKN